MSKEIKPPEAFRGSNLFECGIGNVVLLRFKNSGIHAVIVLVDVYCLGVKDVFSTVVPLADYPEPFLSRVFRDRAVPLSPGSARQLIEGAVAYAAKFGLQPHADYPRVRSAFGSVTAESGGEKFEFGRQGKPFFVAGPNETPHRCEFILKQLHKTCGEGNYDYLMPLQDES